MDNENQARPQGGFKRSTIIIKKGLQYRYMALIVLSVVIGILIFGLEIAWNLSRLYSLHPALVAPLLEEAAPMLPGFAIKLAVYLGIVLIVSSVISHRMAGPIFKFEKSAAQVAGGDLTHRIFLRKGDQLVELQAELNKLFKSLHDTVAEDRKNARAIAHELETAAAKEQDPELKAKLGELAAQAAKLTERFKLNAQ